MAFSIRTVTLLAIISILPVYCWSQQTPPAQDTTTTSPSQTSKDDSKQGQQTGAQDQQSGTPKENVPGSTSTQGKVAGTSNDRLFYALPNFLTLENAGHVPPLTTKEKFAVVTRGSFDYVQVPWYGFLAGISQAQNSEPGYGQGAAGYGKRFGSAFADGTIENYMTGAILPSLLHQDPRYFEEGKGTFRHRLFYAMSRNIVTRGDSGKEQFNFSEVVGGAASAAISTYSYHPHADRTLSNTASVWGTQYGYDTLTLVVKEFWPDIRRKISHKKNKEAAIGPDAVNP